MTDRCPHCKAAKLYPQRVGVKDGLALGLTCWRCGFWKDIEQRRPERRPAPRRLDTLVQCSVEGCTNMVQVATTTTGRCTPCNRLMKDWDSSAKTKPVPLIQVAGKWIFNPERKKPIHAR